MKKAYPMKHKLLFLPLFGALSCAPLPAWTADAASAALASEQTALRFAIDRYVVKGASLLSEAEIDAAVAPYVGKSMDFSDVQRALEAVEAAYFKRGYTAVRVSLPEQELEKGTVRFHVVEGRFGKVMVRDNRYVTEENVLHALPSVRPGDVPRSRQIARELRLANENPVRQMNVVLKAGEKDGEVDANVIVTDSKPSSWGVTLDNTGSRETGRTRMGISYRHANLFGKDHVASAQYLISPEQPNRVTVLGGSYKIPLYQCGDSLEFFVGYSDVNSVVGGIDNFKGGGLLFSARYNHALQRMGVFDPRLSFGLDWRNFRRIEQTNTAPATVLYNEITVMPLSLVYSAQARLARSNLGFNVSFSANQPGMSKGTEADFAAYDRVNLTNPNPRYKVVRYGANYSQLIGSDWQLRAAVTGQQSRDVLMQGELLRLGGADAVRGFSEGSEPGESGARWNLEVYSPAFGKDSLRTRALAFLDTGEVRQTNGATTSISGAGFGLRTNFSEMVSLRLDAAKILRAGSDPSQRAGDWRAHIGLSATF